MNILLVGSLGKMAKNIKEIANNFNTKIVAEIDKKYPTKPEKQKVGKTAKTSKHQFKNFNKIPLNLVNQIDVVLDFSSPQILDEEIEFCLLKKLPVVICTTGHNDEQKKLIENASKAIPIFYSANTSFSINLLGAFIKKYVDFFKNFDIDIVETHHKTKLDSPSGTAKFFAQILAPLSPTIHSIRAGEIVGEHQIIFTSPYEKIVLSHTAFDRKLFAEGALKICKFLHKKTSPKLYTMDDIFNI